MNKLILALLLLPVLFSACSKEEEPKYTEKDLQSQHHFAKKEAAKKALVKRPKSTRNPVAVVDGIEIYAEDLENGNIDLTVKNEVLYQVGVEKGFDEVVEPKVTKYERNLVLKMIKDELRRGIEPKVTDQETVDYYNNHKHEYTLVEVEELITATRDLAEEVRKEALKGTDFKQIVQLNTTEQGATVAFNQTSNVVRVFNEAVDLGQVSQVINSGSQFIVQKVINKSEPGFDDLKDTIAIFLIKEKADNEYESIIEKLKEEKNVEILAEAEK